MFLSADEDDDDPLNIQNVFILKINHINHVSECALNYTLP